MTFRKLSQSTAFRLAVRFAGLFAISIAIILFVLYSAISRELTEREKMRIDVLRAALVDAGNGGKFEDLKRTVETYATDTEPDEAVYLLTDDAGVYAAGNVEALPVFFGWRAIPRSDLHVIGAWSDNSQSTAVLGRWTDVKGGHLLVAQGNGDLNEVKDILFETLGLASILSAALALIGGAVIGNGTRKRLGAVETSLENVARGNLAARLPRNASNDDLDHISQLVNGALDQLQGAVRSLKNVTSNIAHDLKAPVGRAIQKLERIGDNGGAGDAKDSVEDARDELKSAMRTFEALLRIAEIESGARRARFAPVDVNRLVANAADILDAVASDAGQTLVCRQSPAAIVVRGDAELLTQAFINLIENAIRHCPPGSRISVESGVRAGQRYVAVSDNGPGIPEGERDKVLERLYRLEKSRTTPGSGLGLSLVAAIADLHGAKIELSSNQPGLAVTLKFSGEV